jgi:predicted acetyltransferase
MTRNTGQSSVLFMTIPPEIPLARVELIPAGPEQEPILSNLLQLYAHDFSEFHKVDIGDDGRFVYRRLPLYWTQPARHPFLIKANGKLAGLVLVTRGSEISRNENVWDMTEFFVLRGYRRRGVGIRVAHQVWRRFPGPWEVRVMQSNASARDFWARAIDAFTGQKNDPSGLEIRGEAWNVFCFESSQ